jgi:hypothetical protein
VSPIPSLPTDNLYKFCGVVGALFIIVSGLVFFQAWRDVLGQERLVVTHAANFDEDQRDRAFDLKLTEMTAEPWWQPDGTTAKQMAAARAKSQEEARRILAAIEEATKGLASDRERLAVARYDFRIVALAAGVAALVGGLLGSYGFVNWRILQLKQDRLLELELRSREQDRPGSSTAS